MRATKKPTPPRPPEQPELVGSLARKAPLRGVPQRIAVADTVQLARCIAVQILGRLPALMDVDDIVHTGRMGAARYLGECRTRNKRTRMEELKKSIRGSILDRLRSTATMATDLGNLETKLKEHQYAGALPRLADETRR